MGFPDKTEATDKTKASKKAPSTLPPAAKMTRRIEGLPSSVDLGEHVVGSDHHFTLAHVAMRDPGAWVLITTEIQGSSSAAKASKRQSDAEQKLGLPGGAFDDAEAQAFRAVRVISGRSSEDGTFVDPSAPQVIQVGFAPFRSGELRAVVRLFLKWSDGIVTERLVPVRGRGRLLEDAPDGGLPERSPRADDTEDDSNDPPSAKQSISQDQAEAAFVGATDRARDAAETLAGMQDAGRNLAKDEALSYQATPPPTPWWVTLAEIAVTMGIAGVAGVVAKQLGNKLGNTLIARSGIDPKAVKPGDLKIVLGVTDAIKEGLKSSGKKAVAAATKAPSSKSSSGQDSAKDSDDEEFSSNKTLEFFARQHTHLVSLRGKNKTMITNERDRLRPVMKASPMLAITTMTSLAEALEVAATEHAAREQALATESQWVVGIARTREEAFRPKFDPRKPQADRLQGLLRIAISVRGHADVDRDGITVRSAAINGISQEIADRLWKESLDSVAIPIAIDTSWQDGAELRKAHITRDTAGRIRIKGDIPGGSAPQEKSEPQKIRAATRLVRILLEQSLKDWSLTQIKTDDATGRK